MRESWLIGCAGVLLSAMCGLFVGCGAPPSVGSPYQPFDDGAIVQVSRDGTTVLSTKDGPCADVKLCEEIKREGDHCEKGDQGAADVLVDDGKVVGVICYSNKAGPAGRREVTDAWDGKLEGNGGIIVFAPESDGKRSTGGLKLNGNKNTVYGNGPEKTIIEGNSDAQGNNTRLRGFTLHGDLKVNGNDASLSLVVVHGNLTVEGNNAVLAHVTVFGDLRISGNNDLLMKVLVSGKSSIVGQGHVCDSAFSFEDKDQSDTVEPAEIGSPLSCKQKK